MCVVYACMCVRASMQSVSMYFAEISCVALRYSQYKSSLCTCVCTCACVCVFASVRSHRMYHILYTSVYHSSCISCGGTYMYPNSHIYVYVYMFTRTGTDRETRAHTHKGSSMGVFTYLLLSMVLKSVCASCHFCAYVCACGSVVVHVCMYMCVCVYVYMYGCMSECMFVCI